MTVIAGQPDPLVKKVIISTDGTKTEGDQPRSKVSELLDQREDLAIRRFNAAQAEKLAKEAEEDLRRVNSPDQSTENSEKKRPLTEEEIIAKREAEATIQMEKMATKAKSLIDAGIDPRQVSTMLMGLMPQTSSSIMPYNIPQVSKSGMDFDDFIKFYKLLNENRETNDLKQMVVALNRQIIDMEKRLLSGEAITGKKKSEEQIDPLEYLVNSKKKLIELGVVVDPKNVSNGEKTIEQIKEENRHNEEMARLNAEKANKERMADIWSNIPKDVGRAIGQHIENGGSLNGEKVEDIAVADNKDDILEEYKCECGQKIIYPPEAKIIVCPKCGNKYAREQQVATK